MLTKSILNQIKIHQKKLNNPISFIYINQILNYII